MNFIGEIAGILTSVSFAIAAIGFTRSGEKFTSGIVNRVRVTLALILLLIINTQLYGEAIPFSAGITRWGWLFSSGVVGLVIGDAFLLRCYQLVGPRLGLLLRSSTPVFGAVIAWIFFHETLTVLQIFGILLTTFGIGWVVMARSETEGNQNRRVLSKEGIVYGLLAALGQAVGLVLAKPGLEGDFPPFAGSLIRLMAAFIFLWGFSFLQREVKSSITTIVQNKKATAWAGLGALFGPVFGVTFSLVAVQYTEIGIASTLMSLSPVVILPISYFMFKERFGWQVIIGTLIVFGGVVLLF